MTGLVKATVFSSDIESTKIVPFNEDEQFYSNVGIIPPPYEPEQLCIMFDRSSALRPNVDVLATNVEGFGYRLEPAIDLNEAGADEKVRDSLLIEALFDGTIPDLSADAVAARRRELEVIARVETLKTNLFFSHCCQDVSFTELRTQRTMDLEVTGNAYWEALRDRMGEVSRFNYVPSIAMRLMHSDTELVTVSTWQRVSAASYRRVEEKRRFRRFVQYVRGQEVGYFKSFGDPRTLSYRTGRYYSTPVAMKKAEGKNALPATEIVHFKIHSPISVYGVPRWVGASLAVLGTRDSEETNLAYFRNKAIPPCWILVSGGTLAAGAVDRIKDYIATEVKGKENFHSCVVLEAEPAMGGAVSGIAGGRVRIDIKSMMGDLPQDALFQEYEANNADKVGAQFRIPPILRGSMKDFNRSTAEAAIRYAEQQVFQPERQRFDHFINTKILADRGVRFLLFVSNSPLEKDPPVLVEMAAKLVDSGVITPNEARAIVRDAFNSPQARLDSVEAAWARIPPKQAELGFAPEPTAEERAAENTQTKTPDIKLAPTDAVRAVTVNEARSSMKLGPLLDAAGQESKDGFMSFAEFVARQEARSGAPSPEQQVQNLLRLRNRLRAAENTADESALSDARAQDSELKLLVPEAEWKLWFEDPK